MGQASNAIRPPHLSRHGVHPLGVAQVTTAQASSVTGNFAIAAQRAVQARQSLLGQSQTSRHGLSLPGNAVRVSTGDQRGAVGRVVQADSRVDGLVDLPSEQNWRPTGRMRGSLSGPAYSSARNQFMIQPTQPTQPPQPTRPPLVPTSSPQMVSPNLQELIANSRNARAPPALNHTTQ